MEQRIEDFLIYLKSNKNISDNTAMSYKRDLTMLSIYFTENGINDWSKVTSTNINSYILYLERQGKSAATVARNVSAFNTFFKYLLVKGVVNVDTTNLVKAPKIEKKIPDILSVEEIEKLLTQPNTKNIKGIRDKALLELMYATGVRVSELISLKISDVNLQLGYIVCKNEKKNRVIPFGNKVKVALSKYLYEARKNVEENSEELLFLNCFGKQMTRQGVWKIIKSYASQAGIEKEITPHTLRHSFATHLLKSGKNIKEVQEIMGHTDIISTSIYSNI